MEIIILFMFGLAIYAIYKNRSDANELDELISNIEDFDADYFLKGKCRTGILIDSKREEVFIYYEKMFDLFYDRKPFSDIISCEVITNGVTITRTSRGSQLSGALAGTLIAPGAGTIIGGLSASKISKEDIKSFELLITFEDLESPSLSIEISPVVQIAQEWHGRIQAIIRLSEKEAKLSNFKSKENESIGGNDDLDNEVKSAYTIQDLNDMLHMGLITESDYEEKIVEGNYIHKQ